MTVISIPRPLTDTNSCVFLEPVRTAGANEGLALGHLFRGRQIRAVGAGRARVVSTTIEVISTRGTCQFMSQV